MYMYMYVYIRFTRIIICMLRVIHGVRWQNSVGTRAVYAGRGWLERLDQGKLHVCTA